MIYMNVCTKVMHTQSLAKFIEGKKSVSVASIQEKANLNVTSMSKAATLIKCSTLSSSVVLLNTAVNY